MWDPTARPVDVVLPLNSSGGEASVVLRRWTARERIAYEDRMTSFYHDKKDGQSEVLIGSLRLHGACLTIQRVEGFPPGFTVTYEQNVKEKGGKVRRMPVTQPFDPRLPEHLMCLSPEVFDEIVTLALEVQPLPGSEEDAADKGDEDDEADGEGEQGEDPSRTPLTLPAGVDLEAMIQAELDKQIQ